MLVCGDYSLEYFLPSAEGSSSYADIVNAFAEKYPNINTTSLLVPKSCTFNSPGSNGGAALGADAVAADAMSGGFGEDFAADGADLRFGAGGFRAGSMHKLRSENFAADGAGLRRGAGCCRTGSVSGGFHKNFAAFGAGLRLGAGCRRTGSMFMTAGGKRRGEHYGYK